MDGMVSAAPIGRLALGSVQWGLPYGIANRRGVPSDAELDALLAVARAAGLDTLDTARAYGDAEVRVGARLAAHPGWRVVTKLDPGVAPEGATAADVRRRVRASVEASRLALGVPRLDTLLLHRPVHRTAAGGAAWDELRRLRDAGVIGRLGISAVDPGDAFDALVDPDVQAFQVAASVLDRRLAEAGFFAAAAGREVFVRSVYVQGLAFLGSDALPPGLTALAPTLGRLDVLAAAHGLPRWQLFLAYARDVLPGRPVLGFEAAAQLAEAVAAWASLPPLGAALAELVAELPELPAELVQPSRWRVGARP